MTAIRYQPVIDGLRAIAIIAVLLFHLAPRLLPGGFCGVDVFFVISGYLITSIQLAELEAGTFSLTRFYQRRIARICPALLAVASATLLGAIALYDAQDRAAAGANFTAAILSVANIKVMVQGNYFHLSQDTQPFMHFWSLSLEEQFYIAFPALIAIAYRFGRQAVLAACLMVAVGSFVACVVVTQIRPTWAFFLLPTRAWELLCGTMLAFCLRSERFRPTRFISASLQMIGLGGLSVSFILLNESRPFPGSLALIPVLATVALIAGMREAHWLAGNVLGHPAAVLIGRLSYSLYLWHWPINSFVDYSVAMQSESVRAGIKVLTTAALAYVCYYGIESPLRTLLAAPQLKRAAFGLLVVAMLISPLGLAVNREGYPRAWPPHVAEGGRVFNRGGDRGVVAIYGDSIAASFAKLVKEVCLAEAWECRIMAVPGAIPVPQGHKAQPGMWEDAINAWRRDKPHTVIIGIAWGSYLERDPNIIRRMIDEVSSVTDQIILLTSAPSLPVAEVRSFLRDGGKLPLLERVDDAKVRKRVNAALHEFIGGKVSVIDVDDQFVDEQGVIRVLDPRGHSLFQDRGHLAYRGTALLEEAIRDGLHRTPAHSKE